MMGKKYVACCACDLVEGRCAGHNPQLVQYPAHWLVCCVLKLRLEHEIENQSLSTALIALTDLAAR